MMSFVPCRSAVRRALGEGATALALALTAVAPTVVAAQEAPPPSSGVELIQRMHDRGDQGWFRTLTFVQRTTQHRPDSADRVSTWYEAVLAPDRLRIDMGDLADRNGVLYTADSMYVVRGGLVTRTSGEGNPFLPFVVGVYMQPVERTLRQLSPLGIDMSLLRSDEWRERPVYVVGARDARDVVSPQFWVDAERLALVRMVLAASGAGGGRAYDIHLDDYVLVGGGWLATKVVMYSGGAARQTEEYSDWRAGVALPEEFFAAESWTRVPHWAAAHER
ncbi:MAG TPA: hypothetical protein VIQ74_16700 [Gemmatimonadaceae bacterium]|jgi:hypothetical protein